MKKIDDIVIIDRFDYDELIEKANKTDAEIKKQAERIFMRENEVPVRIEFDQYRNNKNFNVPIGFVRTFEKDSIYEALDKIEPQIKEWMKENMSMFDRELKDQYLTKKNCIGLSKRVTNLEGRLQQLKIKYTFLFLYAAIVSAIVFFLLYYLKIN